MASAPFRWRYSLSLLSSSERSWNKVASWRQVSGIVFKVVVMASFFNAEYDLPLSVYEIWLGILEKSRKEFILRIDHIPMQPEFNKTVFQNKGKAGRATSLRLFSLQIVQIGAPKVQIIGTKWYFCIVKREWFWSAWVPHGNSGIQDRNKSNKPLKLYFVVVQF